jgi:predicted membrane-bound mannosyltransferase
MAMSDFVSGTHTHSKTTRQPATPDTRPFALTLEQCAYIIIGIAALLTRMWALGDRSLHHDETLHAIYSWNIYTGKGYIHDPLLHGPFLYYFGALMFFLFGDNDLTARLGYALFGTILVLLPYLVRREIGRVAALLASAYMLISPVFLYIGRFARHDIYSVTFEMLVFIGIVRYATTRQSRWLYLSSAAFGLMFANQETSYLFLLIIAIPLVFLLLWHTFKPAILLAGAVAFAIAASIFVLPGEATKSSNGTVQRDPVTQEIEVKEPGPLFQWPPLETADNNYALQIRNRPDTHEGKTLIQNLGQYILDLWKFFQHPAVLSAIGSLLIGLLLIILLVRVMPLKGGENAWHHALRQHNPVVSVYQTLAMNRRWLIALALFFAIYTLLFTAFFSNLLGTLTGTTGSLLYWLAQHEVQRGGQPFYYYLVILLIYEPLLLVWGIIGGILIAGMWLRHLFRTAETPTSEQPQAETPPGDTSEYAPQQAPRHQPSSTPLALYTPTFLAWWSLTALGIYSWAGEKMPWLTIHITLPLVLLGAWACQWVLFRIDGGAWRTRPYRFLSISAVTIFAVVIGLNFVVITTFVGASNRADVPGLILVALTLVLFIMLLIAAGLNWGWRWAFTMLAICISLLGGVYNIRNAYRLAYQNGDVAREMMTYTQTSPEVMRMIRHVEEISLKRTGGLDMPIIYDNETVWQWYLRNFTNAQRIGPQLTTPPDNEVQVVFMLKENIDSDQQTRDNLQGFRMHQFPLRWWLPENDIYRLYRSGDWQNDPLEDVSLLARTIRAPLEDDTLIDLWQFLLFRETQAPLGSTDFVIAARPTIANQLGLGIGGELHMTDE